MKNAISVVFVATLVFVSMTISTGFISGEANVDGQELLELADNTCTLYVKTSSGSAAKSVRVATDVSGGISCAGGRTFYTDGDGKVTLKWVSGCYLKKVFVNGKGYEVDYKNGGTYYLTMK